MKHSRIINLEEILKNFKNFKDTTPDTNVLANKLVSTDFPILGKFEEMISSFSISSSRVLIKMIIGVEQGKTQKH